MKESSRTFKFVFLDQNVYSGAAAAAAAALRCCVIHSNYKWKFDKNKKFPFAIKVL